MNEALNLRRKELVGSREGAHLLITGGVHGDEFEPMAAIRKLIQRFEKTSATSMKGRLTLVPVVNEPAFVQGARTAEDGLDLARVCPGLADGANTLGVAHALSELIRSADFYIDLHTGGTEFSLLPLVGYTLHPNSAVLESQRKMARAFNLSVIWGTTPTKNGRSLSVARDANVPGIYAEYHGAATCDPRGVDAYVEGCLNVMAVLGMIDRVPPASRVEHVVEDSRSDSGHLQICNPAPISGFFQPAVELGQLIEAGQPIGTVCDVLGDEVQTVHAQQNGIVLMLRTFPRVRAGESVGVILEASS